MSELVSKAVSIAVGGVNKAQMIHNFLNRS